MLVVLSFRLLLGFSSVFSGSVRLPHRDEIAKFSFPLSVVFTYQKYPIAGAASVLALGTEAAAAAADAAAAAVAAAVVPEAAVASVPAARAPFLLPSVARQYKRSAHLLT